MLVLERQKRVERVYLDGGNVRKGSALSAQRVETLAYPAGRILALDPIEHVPHNTFLTLKLCEAHRISLSSFRNPSTTRTISWSSSHVAVTDYAQAAVLQLSYG